MGKDNFPVNSCALDHGTPHNNAQLCHGGGESAIRKTLIWQQFKREGNQWASLGASKLTGFLKNPMQSL